MSGQYGNFKDGSRDLQEVLRKFLKWAHEQWAVAWVVLGGDVSIIPPRRVAAALQGQIGTQGEDPPEDDTSFWTGTFLKMKVVKPDDWWPGDRKSVV